MILELAYHAIKKIVKNFRSVVLAMIGIIISVCVMFSVFICGNLSKKIVLELLIKDTPQISAITCYVKCDEKYQLTLDELISLENEKTDEIERIIISSESKLIGNFISYDVSSNICGIYGKPLDINMIKGEFLSSKESLLADYNKIIIDEITAMELFGSVDDSLYKNVDFIDYKGNIYNFCISGIYENKYNTNSRVYYISLATYYNISNNDSSGYISRFQALIKEYDKLADMEYYLDNFLESRYHKEGEYDWGVVLADMTESINMLVNFISGILAICSLIIFIVSGISLRNVIISIMKSYKREIGIKKAIGASERVISAEYLFQGIIISLTGTFIGFGIMFFMVNFLNNNLDFIISCINNMFDLYIEEEKDTKLYISDVQALIVALSSVLTVVICCNEPIRESANMSIVESIRS